MQEYMERYKTRNHVVRFCPLLMHLICIMDGLLGTVRHLHSRHPPIVSTHRMRNGSRHAADLLISYFCIAQSM
jgi:hypothetical protein